MRSPSRRIALSLCLGALLAPAGASARPARRAGKSTPMSLTVRIYDRAGLAPGRVTRAQAIAERLLGAVRIEPRWLDCRPAREESGACPPARPEDVFVVIMPRALAGERNPGAVGLAVLRADLRRGSHIFIFQERLAAATENGEVDVSVVLGHLLAHEIGHLLMGPGSHSIQGLMAARWSRADLGRMARGNLVFTSAEGQRMRHGLAAPLLP